MGLGIGLGVIVFLLTGGVVHAVIDDANQSMWVALAAGVGSFAYGYHLTEENHKRKCNPAPRMSPLDWPQAFSTTYNVITATSFGTDWWTLRVADSAAGVIVAVLQFYEYDTNGQAMPRQVVLHVRLGPGSQSGQGTSVAFQWETHSGLNRRRCHEVIDEMTSALHSALQIP